MAKIDADPSLFMNPAVYANLKKDKQETKKIKNVSNNEFSNLIDNFRLGQHDTGAIANFPKSEDATDFLMDEVRSAGDALKSRPLPEEILKYKQAVRNFINYVVQNVYSVEQEDGILNKYKPQFRGRRNTPEAEDRKGYTKIQVIDEKLEQLAAWLLTGQRKQLEVVSRLEEIRGLLIDLMQ